MTGPTCEGDESALAWAAAVSLAIVGGFAVGLSAGVVTWLVVGTGGGPRRP